MKYLVDQGADINIKDHTGVSKTTLLHMSRVASFTLLEVVACPPEIFLLGMCTLAAVYNLKLNQLAMVGV